MPCRCCHCGGDHPSNYSLCKFHPKTGKNSKNIQKPKGKKPNNNSNRTFTSRKVDPARSYLGVASGSSEASPPPPPQNLSVPNNDAIPATDFISYILAFEKSYHSDIVLAAF